MAIVPMPDGDEQLDPMLAVHVHVTPVNGAGNESATEAPIAVLGPLLTTATVHLNEMPAAATGTLGVFVNERSATTDDVSVAVPVSFAAFGSTGVLDRRVAVLTSVPGPVMRPVSLNISVRVAGTAPSVQMPVPESKVPCDALANTNATPAGNTSLTSALVASPGPRLVTAIV